MANRPIPCWVYVITDDAGHCKVGIARDVNNRRKMLQVGNPHPLRVVRAWLFWNMAQAEYVEFDVLWNCWRHAMRGEWVRGRPAAVCRLVEKKIRRFTAPVDTSRYPMIVSVLSQQQRRTAIGRAGGLRVLEVRA